MPERKYLNVADFKAHLANNPPPADMPGLDDEFISMMNDGLLCAYLTDEGGLVIELTPAGKLWAEDTANKPSQE